MKKQAKTVILQSPPNWEIIYRSVLKDWLGYEVSLTEMIRRTKAVLRKDKKEAKFYTTRCRT